MYNILKIEEHNYSIVYVKEGSQYNVYRRINEDTWEIFRREAWKKIEDYSELERIFSSTPSQKITKQ